MSQKYDDLLTAEELIAELDIYTEKTKKELRHFLQTTKRNQEKEENIVLN